jgi:CheY-like chemotaxis protein
MSGNSPLDSGFSRELSRTNLFHHFSLIDPCFIILEVDSLTILVAENDPNDVVFLQKAFKKNAIASPVFFCESGEELIAYLKGEGQFSDRSEYPFPRVLITDLKMPRCGGFEVLQWLKKKPEVQCFTLYRHEQFGRRQRCGKSLPTWRQRIL